MATLELNGKSLATQTSSAEPVIASTVTGGAGLSGMTSLGTVTQGNLSNTAIVYPAGHVSNVFRFTDTSSGTHTSSNYTNDVIVHAPFSFSAISGRHYLIQGAYFGTVTILEYDIEIRGYYAGLYYGTTSRAKGDTTTDTKISYGLLGRTMSVSSSASATGTYQNSYVGSFTAGSTATHYIYSTQKSQHNRNTNTALADATNPHNCNIIEVMP